MRMAGRRRSGEGAGAVCRLEARLKADGTGATLTAAANVVAAVMSIPQVAEAKKRLIATVVRLENWSTSCKQMAYRKSNRNKYRPLRSTERGREERAKQAAPLRENGLSILRTAAELEHTLSKREGFERGAGFRQGDLGVERVREGGEREGIYGEAERVDRRAGWIYERESEGERESEVGSEAGGGGAGGVELEAAERFRGGR